MLGTGAECDGRAMPEGDSHLDVRFAKRCTHPLVATSGEIAGLKGQLWAASCTSSDPRADNITAITYTDASGRRVSVDPRG